MKIKVWSFLLAIPFILSSCGTNPKGLVYISQNGDIYNMAEPSVADETVNYVRPTDSVEVLSLLANNEPFMLYVAAEGCSGCRAFKPNLLRYIYETKALVYYLNASDNEDYLEYSKIWQRYQDMFMANLEVPYLMIIENEESYAKGAVSKMTADTYAPFANMMNLLVKATNITSLKSYESANHYLQDDSSLYFFYDRTDEEAIDIYSQSIFPLAKESETNLHVVDFSTFDEISLDNLRETFSLGETIGPVAQYYENGLLVEAHLFGIDETSDSTFLETYF